MIVSSLSTRRTPISLFDIVFFEKNRINFLKHLGREQEAKNRAYTSYSTVKLKAKLTELYDGNVKKFVNYIISV